MQRILIIIAALFALILAAGCGGESEEAPTKKQFIAAASAACEKAEKEELEGVVAYKKKHPDAEEEELVQPILLPALEKQARKLEALGAPEGDEASVEAMNEALEAGLQKTKQDPSAVLSPSTNPFKEFDQLAKRYGLVKCSYVP